MILLLIFSRCDCLLGHGAMFAGVISSIISGRAGCSVVAVHYGRDATALCHGFENCCRNVSCLSVPPSVSNPVK